MLVFIFFQIDIAHLKRRALFKSNGSKYCLKISIAIISSNKNFVYKYTIEKVSIDTQYFSNNPT